MPAATSTVQEALAQGATSSSYLAPSYIINSPSSFNSKAYVKAGLGVNVTKSIPLLNDFSGMAWDLGRSPGILGRSRVGCPDINGCMWHMKYGMWLSTHEQCASKKP